jgi:uncharacterized protein YkwD
MLTACSSSSDDRGGGGSGGGASSACAPGAAAGPGLECEMLELVNQERAQGATCGGQAMAATSPLQMNGALRTAARGHAIDMAKNNYFSHTGQDGSSASDRIGAAGYDWSRAGENIAAGSASAETTLQQWMSSSGHCENIMDPQFAHIGIGYASDPAHDLKHIWVQTFGTP